MRIGQLEVEALKNSNLWIGKSALYADAPVLVRLSIREDPYVFAQARLIGEIVSDAPFKLIDIFVDDSRGSAGYALLLPGPVSILADSISPDNLGVIARRMITSVQLLHKSHIAYRRFEPMSFLLAGDYAVPCDFGRATRMRGEEGCVDAMVNDMEIPEAVRLPLPYDPPEARGNGYDGRKADIYGLGFMLRTLGLDVSEHGRMVARMLDPDPNRRPSLDAALNAF